MAHLRPRGIVRRTGAALAAASVLCVGLAATPAQAATRSLISVLAPDTQVLLPQSDGGAASAFRTVTPLVLSEGPAGTLTGVKLTIDAGKLAHVAELSLPKECRFSPSDPSHLHAVCSLGSVRLLGSVDLGIRSAPGAAAGATGSIVFTVTATNATEDPEDARGKLGTTRVSVGHGPDLAAGSLGALSVSPGTAEAYSPQVTNRGDRDAKGVVMYLDAAQLDGGSGLSLTGPRHSNCLYHYGEPGPGADRTGILCSFPDVTVHPGQTYRLSTPVDLTATADATEGYFEYGFDLVGGQLTDPDAKGTKGSGPALGLTPVPAPTGSSRSLVQDIDYSNNTGVSAVSTGRIDDVAATAGDVTGTVGKAVRFHTSVVNTGTVPTVPIPDAPTTATTAADVVFFPVGVTVTAAPASCTSEDGLSVGAAKGAKAAEDSKSPFAAKVRSAEGGLPTGDGSVYICLVEKVLQPGQSATFDFTLKPTKVLHKAGGTAIAISGGTGIDDNVNNNVVNFTVSAAKGSTVPTSTPRPTASATASGSSGSAAPSASASAGGGLAATGGGSDALPLTLTGAAAILLGAGGLLFARRRSGSHG
jgi:hypothetical protein